jgi:4-aminobutyrate aminotransferase-like enzyme
VNTIANEIADKVIVTKAGSYANVLRLVPPLCFTEQDAAEVIDRLDSLLTSLT